MSGVSGKYQKYSHGHLQRNQLLVHSRKQLEINEQELLLDKDPLPCGPRHW